MDSREFAKTLEKQVADFCETLNTKLPAYSYIPLDSDEAAQSPAQLVERTAKLDGATTSIDA